MRRTMVAMLAASALASAAGATVQTVSFSGSGGNLAMIPLFSTSLGTLQSASVSASYRYSAGFMNWGFAPADHAVAGLFTLGSLSFALNAMTATTIDASPFGIFGVTGSGSASFNGAADLALLSGSSLALAAQIAAAAAGPSFGGSPTAAVGYTVSYTYDDGRAAVRLGGTAGGSGNIGAVPEPASWAMMIGGFGLTGTALRRARRTARLAQA